MCRKQNSFVPFAWGWRLHQTKAGASLWRKEPRPPGPGQGSNSRQSLARRQVEGRLRARHRLDSASDSRLASDFGPSIWRWAGLCARARACARATALTNGTTARVRDKGTTALDRPSSMPRLSVVLSSKQATTMNRSAPGFAQTMFA